MQKLGVPPYLENGIGRRNLLYSPWGHQIFSWDHRRLPDSGFRGAVKVFLALGSRTEFPSEPRHRETTASIVLNWAASSNLLWQPQERRIIAHSETLSQCAYNVPRLDSNLGSASGCPVFLVRSLCDSVRTCIREGDLSDHPKYL